MIKRFSKIFTFIIAVICLHFQVNAQTMTVTGNNWTVPVETLTEAGTNYVGTYESATNQVLINASVPLLLGTGKVSAHYEGNPNWNAAIIPAIKRTGNGSTLCLLCSISGNQNYINLTSTDVPLFTISAVLALASYSNIPMQLKVSGVSVTVPASNYAAKIVFTISAN